MNEVLSDAGTRTRSRGRLLPLVAVLAVGFLGMGASSASAATTAVPFAAAVTGTVSATGPGTTGLPTFSLAGTGYASYLGKVSYTGKVVVTAIDSTGVITDTLTETLTATNGDTLTLLCHQVAAPISPGSPVLHGVDQWTVIGGTGRFSAATGSGTGDTYVDNFRVFVKGSTGAITK
jgi:hypothetical protein